MGSDLYWEAEFERQRKEREEDRKYWDKYNAERNENVESLEQMILQGGSGNTGPTIGESMAYDCLKTGGVAFRLEIGVGSSPTGNRFTELKLEGDTMGYTITDSNTQLPKLIDKMSRVCSERGPKTKLSQINAFRGISDPILVYSELTVEAACKLLILREHDAARPVINASEDLRFELDVDIVIPLTKKASLVFSRNATPTISAKVGKGQTKRRVIVAADHVIDLIKHIIHLD